MQSGCVDFNMHITFHRFSYLLNIPFPCHMHRTTFLLCSCVMVFKLCQKAETLWMACSHSWLHLYLQAPYVNNFILVSRAASLIRLSVFMPPTGLFKLLNSVNIFSYQVRWQEALFSNQFSLFCKFIHHLNKCLFCKLLIICKIQIRQIG